MNTLKEGADALFEPSPYTRYVLQDDERKSFWTGHNPVSPKGWTRDIQKAKVVVGLAGVVETRREVSPIVEFDEGPGLGRLGAIYRRTRITYFRELEGAAEERAHA
jgi:hypothetical protein